MYSANDILSLTDDDYEQIVRDMLGRNGAPSHFSDSHQEFYKKMVTALCKWEKRNHNRYTRSDATIMDIMHLVLSYAYRGFWDFNTYSETKSSKEHDIGAFPYISYSRAQFLGVLHQFDKLGKRRFVDVGSGMGDKILLAKLFGNFNHVTGLEINVHTYNVGLFFITKFFHYGRDQRDKTNERKFRTSDMTLLNEDAFDCDFSAYDAVYMYKPIHSCESMNKLYAHIISTMPVGGVIIDVLGFGKFPLWEVRDVKQLNLIGGHETWEVIK